MEARWGQAVMHMTHSPALFPATVLHTGLAHTASAAAWLAVWASWLLQRGSVWVGGRTYP